MVDDDATVRELVERHLERSGFAVVTAGGGQGPPPGGVGRAQHT